MFVTKWPEWRRGRGEVPVLGRRARWLGSDFAHPCVAGVEER